MILSVDKVDVDLATVLVLGLEVLAVVVDSVAPCSWLLLPPCCDFRSLIDLESRGNGCCSCLMAAEGMNLAPETLRLVCTEATMIHPSVEVDGASEGRAVEVVEPAELFR